MSLTRALLPDSHPPSNSLLLSRQLCQLGVPLGPNPPTKWPQNIDSLLKLGLFLVTLDNG
jgi:hypothetical protein